ncbi:MAG TPA: methionyl-tRNA formyltransferase, partial [Thermoleophilaceae bacterium]|nr:methionyl-tRNA formyltransferase [Thermoleophilaceae bacterium]
LVVTRPDRPRGRGRKLAPPPVAEQAPRLGIDLIQPESVNSDEARERIEHAAPEVVCVCAFGALIKEPLLSSYEMLNVHPSLLPRWRGAAPIERAIEAGDEETGVTIMRPTADLDAGPVCLQSAEAIEPGDDFGTLAARLAALGGELLVEALDERPPFRDQPEEGATYADKLGPEDRRLAPRLDAAALARRVRALHPHVGAWLELPGGERLRVHRAAIAADGGPAPGELAGENGKLLYGASSGALELLQVQPAGGKAMDAAAWLRGHSAAIAGQQDK